MSPGKNKFDTAFFLGIDIADPAVAVVEVMPESASEMVDAISEGDESVEGELSNLMTDKPDTY